MMSFSLSPRGVLVGVTTFTARGLSSPHQHQHTHQSCGRRRRARTRTRRRRRRRSRRGSSSSWPSQTWRLVWLEKERKGMKSFSHPWPTNAATKHPACRFGSPVSHWSPPPDRRKGRRECGGLEGGKRNNNAVAATS